MTEAALRRAVQALVEIQDDLVVIGGTAHRLFLLHPLGRTPGFPLLHAPWRAGLEGEGLALSARVVNPCAYLVQKLLTITDRPSAKRAKDLLYVFDTLSIFQDSLDELGEQASTLVPDLSRKARKSVQKAADEICFTDGETARQASAIAADQRQAPPTALQIARACEHALPRILPNLLLG